jgi:hypothetical protein
MYIGSFLSRKFTLKVVAANLILIHIDVSLINVEFHYPFGGSKLSLPFLSKPYTSK